MTCEYEDDLRFWEHEEVDKAQEYLENLPVCHFCGKPINEDTMSEYFGYNHHNDCLHEILCAQIDENLSSDDHYEEEKKVWQKILDNAVRNWDYNLYYGTDYNGFGDPM